MGQECGRLECNSPYSTRSDDNLGIPNAALIEQNREALITQVPVLRMLICIIPGWISTFIISSHQNALSCVSLPVFVSGGNLGFRSINGATAVRADYLPADTDIGG